MKNILMTAFLLISPIAQAKAVKYQIDCQDFNSLDYVSFNIKIWDEDTIHARIYGDLVAQLSKNLGIENAEDFYEARLTLKRDACHFSKDVEGVFSCHTQEEALVATIYDQHNQEITTLPLSEFSMQLFSETRTGFNRHNGQITHMNGHRLQLTLKSEETLKVARGIHDYLNPGAPECRVLGEE